MLARTLFVAVVLIFAVALDAYAPPRIGDNDTRIGSAKDRVRTGNRDKVRANQDQRADDRPANAANARVMTSVTLYHAPNQAIGTLRAGARVRVDRFDRNWAHVTFINNQIAVQGWVQTRALAPLNEGQGDRAGTDRVKTQEERERKRNADRERKQEERRNEAKDR
ncbi:MAG: hypothetical protein JW889_08425 [Verrucomicrobia bacterium]|nr:hypothetical protein [Verrucomicrobiota bacterium]